MLTQIYQWFNRLASQPAERDNYSSGYWQAKVRREVLNLCRDIQGKALEVGCGEGLFLLQLAGQNPDLEIWGIDNNSLRLKEAEKKTQEKNFKNINLSLQDAISLSFKNEYFDAIVCINVFFNMQSLDLVKQTLIQMKRVCKKSGRLIFEFRNSYNPFLKIKYKFAKYYDETVRNLPLRVYKLKQIESILKDLNLKIIERRFMGFILKRFAPLIVIEAEKIC